MKNILAVIGSTLAVWAMLTGIAAQADAGSAYCSLPGELVSQDGAGDAADPAVGVVPDPLAQHDVEAVYVAEPAGSDKIYFTIKVASLDPAIPPNSQYFVRFVLADELQYYVAFDPYALPGDPQYVLGRRDPPATPGTSGSLVVIGPADEGSNSPDGFVTWGIKKDRLPSFDETPSLSGVFGQARVSLVAVISSVDESPEGFYDVKGNCGVGKSGGLLAAGGVPLALLLPLGLAAFARRRRT
jgi:hypothetical protein